MMHENFSVITDQLAVGEEPTRDKLEELAGQGYAAIVDVRSEAGDDEALLEELGMAYLRIDVDDTHPPTMDQIMRVFAFVGPFLDGGKKVFVHCQNGYGRSPLTIAAILMNRGMSMNEALSLLYDRHPVTTLMPSQHLFIRRLEEELMRTKSHAK